MKSNLITGINSSQQQLGQNAKKTAVKETPAALVEATATSGAVTEKAAEISVNTHVLAEQFLAEAKNQFVKDPASAYRVVGKPVASTKKNPNATIGLDKTTAVIVKDFLESQGLNVSLVRTSPDAKMEQYYLDITLQSHSITPSEKKNSLLEMAPQSRDAESTDHVSDKMTHQENLLKARKVYGKDLS